MTKPILVIILGTRPEIIKTFPLIQPLKKYFNLKIIFTGQHFLSIMTDEIFDDLKYPKPDYFLKIKSFNHSLQIADMVTSITKILLKIKPQVVLVQGDTNSTLAGALSATKLNLKLVHIEAGARCFNKQEPEELNRILVDHMANLNITFSKESMLHLKRENITQGVYIFPNTIYETCSHIRTKLNSTSIIKNLDLTPKKFVLVTVHRKMNLNPVSLNNLFNFLNTISTTQKIVFPIHPRTKDILKKLKIEINKNILLVEPFSYKKFLTVLKSAHYIVSDSGGVVDESCFFNVPLFIYREETERNDIIKQKSAFLLPPKSSTQKKVSIIKKSLKQKTSSGLISYNFCAKIAKLIYKDLCHEK